jgi:hypothetical protein
VRKQLSSYSVYAVTPSGRMLGPIHRVEAHSDDIAISEAVVVTDHVFGARVLEGSREVGTLPRRATLKVSEGFDDVRSRPQRAHADLAV